MILSLVIATKAFSIVFARLIAEAKGETVSGKSLFADVSSKDWYSSYIGYLEKYNVINGYIDGAFKPDAYVTRSEFVAMTVRYYDLFNDVSAKKLTGADTTNKEQSGIYENQVCCRKKLSSEIR